MRSVNRVTLMGNLGHKPELIEAKSGNLYARLSIATSHSKKKEDGTWEEVTDWHSVFVWGKLAEICAEHMKKGCGVYVDGHLTYWKEDGKENVFKQSITADLVNFWNINKTAPGLENLDNPDSSRNHNAVAHPA